VVSDDDGGSVMGFWDWLNPINPIPDFSWVQPAIVGAILAVIGLLAFKFMPNMVLKFLIGGGLLAVGIAFILGYLTMDSLSIFGA